jgi:hypothetical protein
MRLAISRKRLSILQPEFDRRISVSRSAGVKKLFTKSFPPSRVKVIVGRSVKIISGGTPKIVVTVAINIGRKRDKNLFSKKRV